MRFSIRFLFVLVLTSCGPNGNRLKKEPDQFIVYDHHVHLMSPTLIAEWKALGVPFSNPNSHYENVDTILHINPADRIDLISMAYVYGNPDYYSKDDAFERMQAENDNLLKRSKAYPERIIPFTGPRII